MGSAKVLLENYRVGSREAEAPGELNARAHETGEAAQLVNLRLDGRVRMHQR